MSHLVQVKWMSMNRVCSSAANEYIEQAVGDVCCMDGQVCECCPLMAVQEVVDKLNIDKSVSKTFFLLRDNVVEKELVTVRVESVNAKQGVYVCVIRRVAFVLTDDHKVKIGGTPGENGAPPLVDMPGYDRVVKEGVVMELHDLPSNVRHEIVEMYSEAGRSHSVQLLGPANRLRKEQAAERFEQTVNAMVGKRVAGMAGAAGSGLRAQKLIADFAAKQAQIELANQAAQNQNMGEQWGVQRTSHSSLNDDDHLDIGVKGKRAADKASKHQAARDKKKHKGLFAGMMTLQLSVSFLEEQLVPV